MLLEEHPARTLSSVELESEVKFEAQKEWRRASALRFLWRGSTCGRSGFLGKEKILLEELPEQSFSRKDKRPGGRASIEEICCETEIL